MSLFLIYPATLSLCWPFHLPSVPSHQFMHILLFIVLTNAGVKPSMVQVCHKQVGGKEGTQDNKDKDYHQICTIFNILTERQKEQGTNTCVHRKHTL